MFTGIIKETGRVKTFSLSNGTAYIEIDCSVVPEKAGVGDSVAVNGVCLSVVRKDKGLLGFDVVGNTYKKTNLKRLKKGDGVNLENSLRMGDDISGHMVSGHVDAERAIKNLRKDPGGWVLDISIVKEDLSHLVARGSVAVDGISLTIGEIRTGYIRIFLIPHTVANTTLARGKRGDHVNIEFDMMGKHAAKNTKVSGITMKTLSEKGFI